MGLIVIAVNPRVPFNPYPPPTTQPATPSPTSTRVPPSPTPTAPPSTLPARPTPTPMAVVTLTPMTGDPPPFAAVVEWVEAPNCTALRLMGTVADRAGKPLEEFPIHVWGPTIDTIVLSGSAPRRGPGGWEVVVPQTDSPLTSTWHVQLHQYSIFRTHPPLSAIVRVDLPAACRDELPLIRFVQHPAEEGESP